MFNHGLDRRAASYTWTVLFILLLLALVYLIRETLFVFALALLFSYLLWPLVHCIDRRLPGRSRVPALAIVYSSMVGLLIIIGIAVGISSRAPGGCPGAANSGASFQTRKTGRTDRITIPSDV